MRLQVCEGYVFTGICLSTGGMHGSGGDHGRVACVWQGACMTGGMHGGGHVWQGVWWGHAWQGHVWQGACMAGGMHGRGHAWQGACMACTPLADTMRYSQ